MDKLIESIKELITQFEKSKILKSQLITDYYNEVFNTKEKVTNCGSCLRVKLLKLKNWLKEEETKSVENHLTHQQAGAEITIINDADIDESTALLSNDRIIDVLEANDKMKEIMEQYNSEDEPSPPINRKKKTKKSK